MKKILFIVTYLNTGGIIRALQNFLNCYDTTKYEVDVFAMVHHGIFCSALKNCTVLPRNRLLEASVAHFENQHGWSKIESLLMKLLNKGTSYYTRKLLFRKAGKILLKNKEYDAVIGFSEGLPTLFVSMMNHPNKIGWIHCDYANYFELGGGKSELKIYIALQSIVCVSDYTRESFVKIYPSLRAKTYAIYNIIDYKMMREKAKEPITELFDNKYFNIVSVGRLDPVKRLSIVPELARKVVDAGCNIRWYVIGPKGTNDEVAKFYDNLAKYGMGETVYPLGEKSNPYPYISKADLLVNTSVSEACPYVINEAKILRTPVVCTNFGSAREFIVNGENGYSVSINQVASCIIHLIQNSNELQKLKLNMLSFSYDNNCILNQFNTLV